MSAQLTVNQVDENMEEDVEMNVDIPSETEEKFDAAPLEVEEMVNEEVSEKKDKDNPKSMAMDISPMQGVLDVTLFKTPHLTATQSTAQNKERITLVFTASGILDLGS